MPITYTIDNEHGTIETRATGTLTAAEIIDMKRALVADPDFGPGMRELVDLRAVADLRLTAADVEILVDVDEQHADRIATLQIALLTGSDLVFGMARMYQMRGDREDRIAVFRREAEARAWLESAKLAV